MVSLFKEPISGFLTTAPFDRVARETHPGMAHFAGTGPQQKTCRECSFWDHGENDYRASGNYRGLIKPARCRKFRALMNVDGARIPDETAACRHFNQASPVPARFASKTLTQNGASNGRTET
jgi:hypothetical protein